MSTNQYKCIFSGCNEIAVFECSCLEKPRLCVGHLGTHKISNRCNFINIQDKARAITIKLAENALDKLSISALRKAKCMISEINAEIKKNNDFILDKKAKLRNPSNSSENPESIMKWALEFNLEKRSPDEYKASIHNFLSLNGDYESSEDKIKKMKENEKINAESLRKIQMENETLKKMNQEMSQTIKRLESDLNVQSMPVQKPLEKINIQQPLINSLGKLKLDSFRRMNQDQQTKFLIEEKYEDIKNWFFDQAESFKMKKISLTNDSKYIFVCK